MTAQEILNSEDFKQCEAFHGHVCPGLSIGYRAAKAGMSWLSEKRSEDEEIVAIVETDACSADAVQVLTGCTFGKGNFIFRDYGKMALTLLSRNSDRGVRVCLKPGAFKPNDEHASLIQTVMKGQATEAESKRFETLHFQKTCEVLEAPVDGPAKGVSIAPKIDSMLDIYYEALGWDMDGRPLPKTLNKLGLKDVAKELAKI